jgi:hypothetical protein
MCKHSIQFNSILQVSQDPLLHVNIFIQMRRAWNLNGYYVWGKLWLHSATQWCTDVNKGTRMRVIRTKQCSCCEDNYETGATMAVKTTVSTTTEAKQCSYYEGKIMKQGWKQQYTQWCRTLTLKTKFHNNGDKSIENGSVHNNMALPFWRQNYETLVTTALKTTVFTANTALSLLRTKLWNTSDNKKCCSLQLWNYETLVTTNSVSTLLPEEMKSWTTCASNNAHFHDHNDETSMITMTLSMQLRDNGDNNKLEVAIMRQFVTSMNSNNTLWRWNLMKHWLLWLTK